MKKIALSIVVLGLMAGSASAVNAKTLKAVAWVHATVCELAGGAAGLAGAAGAGAGGGADGADGGDDSGAGEETTGSENKPDEEGDIPSEGETRN